MDASEQKRTVGWAFESAMEMERHAAAMYDRYAAVFAHEPDVCAFWAGLAADERHHEAMLQEMLDGLTEAERLAAADDEVATKLDRGQRRIETLSQDRIADFDQAYGLAQGLEFSEINTIFKLLAAGSDESKFDRQSALKEVAQHQQQFTKCAPKLRDAAWRKTVAARTQ